MSIISVVNNYYNYTVGDETISYCLRYRCCFLPYMHVILFIVPSWYFFIWFITFKAFLFSSDVIISGSSTCNTSFLVISTCSSCFNSLKISATNFYPKILKPVVAFIRVNITFLANFIPVSTEKRVWLFSLYILTSKTVFFSLHCDFSTMC